MSTPAASESAKIDAIPTEALINGGQSIKVHFANGTAEEVKVKLVPIGKVAKYLDLIGDPGPFVDFMCSKPKDWSDTLHPDSFLEIDALARRLNDPICVRFLIRQEATMKVVGQQSKGLIASMNSLRTASPAG